MVALSANNAVNPKKIRRIRKSLIFSLLDSWDFTIGVVVGKVADHGAAAVGSLRYSPLRRGTSPLKKSFTVPQSRGTSMCGIGSFSASSKYVRDLRMWGLL